MNLSWKRISMINWTRSRSTDGSSLIVFWTWRREARTTKSLLGKYGAKNRSAFRRIGHLQFLK